MTGQGLGSLAWAGAAYVWDCVGCYGLFYGAGLYGVALNGAGPYFVPRCPWRRAAPGVCVGARCESGVPRVSLPHTQLLGPRGTATSALTPLAHVLQFLGFFFLFDSHPLPRPPPPLQGAAHLVAVAERRGAVPGGGAVTAAAIIIMMTAIIIMSRTHERE